MHIVKEFITDEEKQQIIADMKVTGYILVSENFDFKTKIKSLTYETEQNPELPKPRDLVTEIDDIIKRLDDAGI